MDEMKTQFLFPSQKGTKGHEIYLYLKRELGIPDNPQRFTVTVDYEDVIRVRVEYTPFDRTEAGSVLSCAHPGCTENARKNSNYCAKHRVMPAEA